MKKINAAEFAEVGFQLIGTPYSTLDCQAFYEKCWELLGYYINKKGSNAWFRVMTWTGTPEECIAKFGCIPKGATLFILEFDGGEEKVGYHDGLGNASHIGIKTGRGEGAIHSSSSRKGVVESKFQDKTIKNGGWNRVGLWADGFDYGEKVNALLGSPSSNNTSEIEQPGTKEEDFIVAIAAVVNGNGKSVKLRNSPSTNEGLYWDIADQTSVVVLKKGDNWSQVKAGSHTGYMMTKFLNFEPEDFTPADSYVDENGTVVCVFTEEEAQTFVPLLDKLTNQLVKAVGRG